LKYNHALMMAILHDRSDAKAVNTKSSLWMPHPKAMPTSTGRSPGKFVIDPHGSLKKTA